ncbi:MAG: CDP-alcohol phosphatidyltransferase family protein [Bacteroidia bacterium]|nr:CDP-alcohol phosphatidyltransferase family protein [Bacteroidia bacterium]
MRQSYYIINAITAYRLIAAPVLIGLIFLGKVDLFKWLLALSYFTDLIDGYLARKFKVASILGSRLDSIADDFTILASLIGLLVLKPEFIESQSKILLILLSLFLVQNIFSLIRYLKVSSFHTYLAKSAAILQGFFFIFVFLLPEPIYILFYAAAIITALELIEEIILVVLLPKWEANVKGVYWVLKRKA